MLPRLFKCMFSMLLNDFKSSTHKGLDYVKKTRRRIYYARAPLRRSIWNGSLGPVTYHGGERPPQNTNTLLLRQQKFTVTYMTGCILSLFHFLLGMDDPRGTLLKSADSLED